MEKNEQLEKILTELKEKWNKWKNAPKKELETALKKAIRLEIGWYSATIEEYEKDTKNRSKKLDEMQTKKIEEIQIFLNSFCAALLTQCNFDSTSSKDIKLIQDIANSLNTKDYLGSIKYNYEFYEYEATSWISKLYLYYLNKKLKETPINKDILTRRVKIDIGNEVYIDKWAKFIQDEDFQGLAKWVEKFVDQSNEQIINETNNNIKLLTEQINPKFFLLKTIGENNAVVFDDKGNVHVFIKDHGSIKYSTEYTKTFESIIQTNPQAFPIFKPEEW